jgi:seryl-tRNA synthetase
MLDLKFVRTNPDIVKEALAKRHTDINLDDFLRQEEKRRQILFEVESLKAERNKASEEVARLKKNGGNAEDLISLMRDVGAKIKNLDNELAEIDSRMQEVLYNVPNIPDNSVPVGKDENDNKEIRKWGKPQEFDFSPLPHYELGEHLDILDFGRAGKVAGARFTFYIGFRG